MGRCLQVALTNRKSQSIEQRDAFADEWSIVSMTGELSNTWKALEENFPRDKWDVGLEDLTIGEILGQGAFGIVRKAEMGRRKYLELVNRRKNNYEKKSKCKEVVACTNVGATETVAVKMLKGKHVASSLSLPLKHVT